MLLLGFGQGSVQDQVDAVGGAPGNEQGLGKRLDLNGSDLYCTASVTAAEAKRLRRHLLETHTFDGAAGTLQLYFEHPLALRDRLSSEQFPVVLEASSRAGSGPALPLWRCSTTPRAMSTMPALLDSPTRLVVCSR
jgi:hypothetical protein